MNKSIFIIFFLFGVYIIPQPLCAQEIKNDSIENGMDQLGDITDAFQENFFEGLKQKAIENYELALEALDKAEKVSKGNKETEAVVYFEKAKNLKELKRYDEAENNLNRTLELVGDRLDVLEELYDLYYRENDYEKSIVLVQKLIPFDNDYKEDLANLYSRTKQYDKALKLLDELDQTWGESDYRDTLRSQIYRATGNTDGQIEQLETKVESNPKSERESLKLIYLYSEQGNSAKAFEAAKTLMANNPKSQLVHLALYKFYLDEGNAEEAINSMKIVFASNEVEKESKYKVLGDFIQFVNSHSEYENELENVVALFSSENTATVYLKLGEYYIAKNQKDDALKYYEIGVKKDNDNFNLIKNTLLLQIDFKKYTEVEQLSKSSLEIFPAQPLLYLLNGVANNGLQKPDEALESLETGLDFILDDPKMERDYYEQLSIAYATKGDSKKAAEYSAKAKGIKPSN